MAVAVARRLTSSQFGSAADMISDYDRWSKYYSAVDADGAIVDPCDPSAVRWDAVGAICRVVGTMSRRQVECAIWEIDPDMELGYINLILGWYSALAALRELAGKAAS